MELNRRTPPFRIYTGIEITADDEDWLVLGVQDPELARAAGWRLFRAGRICARKGGFIALAHPFRYAEHVRVDLDGTRRTRSNPLQQHPGGREGDIRSLAANLGLALLCNSDAHNQRCWGAFSICWRNCRGMTTGWWKS